MNQNGTGLNETDMKSIEKIKEQISQKIDVSSCSFSSFLGEDRIQLPKEQLFPLASFLKEEMHFDFLMDLCGVDYPERENRFEVVYQFFSMRKNQRLRLKVPLKEGEEVRSLTSLWKGANWFEREAYDMFGLRFQGHPNLQRILTHHQFRGHPLRKDYEADLQQHCTESLPIHFEGETAEEREYRGEDKGWTPINIGPSHPAMHGTLRLMALLDGEFIRKANVEIGYLHRCFEKMAETHPYNQVIPYTDRLNYCSAPMNNIGYCKTVEKLLGVEIPPRAKAMRVLLAEISRIIDHLVAIGTGAVDLGALTGFFHLFTYREKVYTLFERLCGARLTVSMTRIGGMAQDAPEGWFREVLAFCKDMRKGVDEIDRLLSGNKIFILRTRDVGKVSAEEAIAWGYTGPMLRACGVPLDLRLAEPYYGYDGLNFDIAVGTCGDVYDRYMVRIEEMRQSLSLIEQVVEDMPDGDYSLRDPSIVLPEKKDVYGNIEGLMNHFMLVIKGLRPPKGETYDATEAANGELGFYLISDGSGTPYRLKVRPPSFAIFQSFPRVVEGSMVADAIATVSSMNVIAGELDR